MRDQEKKERCVSLLIRTSSTVWVGVFGPERFKEPLLCGSLSPPFFFFTCSQRSVSQDLKTERQRKKMMERALLRISLKTYVKLQNILGT